VPHMTLTRVISAIFGTCIKVGPFYALVQRLSDLDEKTLSPCNQGCTFIRYWGTPDMPRSAKQFAPECRDAKGGNSECAGKSTHAVFVTIENGNHNMVYGKPTPFQNTQRGYSNLVLTTSEGFSGGGDLIEAVTGLDAINVTRHATYLPPRCPGMCSESMKALCSSDKMKMRAASEGNHLTKAVTLKTYLFGIFVWGFFRMVHDALLVLGALESVSLAVGHLAVIAQIVAMSAGFFWSIGAAEVFVASHPKHHCGCYYEMSTIPMFGVIAIPAGLYMMTRNKLWKLAYSVFHGDYLYCVSYSVPYHIAVENNQDPMYDFLQQNEPVGVKQHENRRISLKMLSFLSGCSNCAFFMFDFCALYIVYACAFPALTVRFYSVVVVGFERKDLHFMHLGAWITLAILLALPGFVFYTQVCRLRIWGRQLLNEFDGSLCQRLRQSSKIQVFNLFVQWFSELVAIITVSLMAFWSLMLPKILWNVKLVTADTAGDIGSAGFYLLSSFLNSWVPSGTPKLLLHQAHRIRAGTYLPIGGLTELAEMAVRYPHLALQEVASCVKAFQQAGGDASRDLHNHGMVVSCHARSEWEEFARALLDPPESTDGSHKTLLGQEAEQEQQQQQQRQQLLLQH